MHALAVFSSEYDMLLATYIVETLVAAMTSRIGTVSQQYSISLLVHYF